MANIFQEQITPDKPKSLSQERIFVYVPKASYEQAGIALYDSDDFVIDNDGKVTSLKTKIVVNGNFVKTLSFTSDPQTQLDDIVDDLDDEVEARTNADSDLQGDIEVINSKIDDTVTNSDKMMPKSYIDGADATLDGLITDNKNDITGLKGRMTTAEGKISSIENVVPDSASAANKLTTEGFVNSSIQNNAANFRGTWSTWSDVPTDDDDYPVDAYDSKIPTTNDYMSVQDASDYSDAVYELGSLVGSWRFSYTGKWSVNGKSGWKPEYKLNDEPFTDAQNNAINSGITSSGVSQITTNKNDISTLSGKVTTNENAITTINGKFDSSITSSNKAQGKNYIDGELAKKSNISITEAFTLEVANWSNNTYSIDVSEYITDIDKQGINLIPYMANTSAATETNTLRVAEANIYYSVVNISGSTKTLVLYCKNVPVSDIIIQLEFYNVMEPEEVTE